MKIISGKYKGRSLLGYDLKGTRPTMDRIKESLFATIQPYIADALVLDLFAGSGNLGIEAISEGAHSSYLVDKSKEATKAIAENIKNIGLSNAYVFNKDYATALTYFFHNNIKFNIIFLDPPYKSNYIEKSLDLISKYHLLAGIIVCESDVLDKIIYPSNYKILKEKKYGDKYIVILEEL